MVLHYNTAHTFKNIPRLLVVTIVIVWLCACSDNSTENEPSTQAREKEAAEPSLSQKMQKDKVGVEFPETAKDELPATTEPHSIPLDLQNQLQLNPEKPKVLLKLELLEHHVYSFQDKPQDILQNSATVTTKQKEDSGKTLTIRGGIITDPDALDLSKSLDGAKVKIDLKWD